jgi:Exo-beta-N-acetylmuramidase NamZ, C-terminal
VALISTARELAPEDFAWRPPPYEYEARLMPIDILWGHDGLRRGVEGGAAVDEIMQGVREECDAFASSTEAYRLYE